MGRDGSELHYELSDKDREAPTLAQASDQGLLPTVDSVTGYLDELRSTWKA